MRIFGLIGYPLTHSFSKSYFTQKFQREGTMNARYELFEIPDINELPALLQKETELVGLNVTIPYKQQVMPFLHSLDASAEKVGAVNVIKKIEDKLIGYNSDYFGFKESLEKWLPADVSKISALVLGTGGASKAVVAVLEDIGIPYHLVSRTPGTNCLSYDQIQEQPQIFQQPKLIVNTTPLGTSPKTETAPELVYELLGPDHYLYDLVYNPAETLFMRLGQEKGAKTKNGLEMLELQAEKAWEIWNTD